MVAEPSYTDVATFTARYMVTRRGGQARGPSLLREIAEAYARERGLDLRYLTMIQAMVNDVL
jgi:hypothetical protein